MDACLAMAMWSPNLATVSLEIWCLPTFAVVVA